MWIFDLFGSFGTFLNMLQLSKTKKHVDYIRLSADTCLTFYTVYYRLYPVMVQYFLCSIYQFALLCKVCPEFTFMKNVLFESREVGTEPMKELEVCVETEEPTQEPTQEPKQEPTEEPKQEPTEEPTEEPKQEPTEEPKQEPTEEPKQEPTEEPKQESTEPKQEPTEEPKQESTGT